MEIKRCKVTCCVNVVESYQKILYAKAYANDTTVNDFIRRCIYKGITEGVDMKHNINYLEKTLTT